MKIASVAQIKAQLSAYLKESEEGPVIVTRNGKPVAALLAVRNDEQLEGLVLAHSSPLAGHPGNRAPADPPRRGNQPRGLLARDGWGEARQGTAQGPR